MTVEHITASEAARLVVWQLEGLGAKFLLRPDGHFRCDLDGVANMTKSRHAKYSQMVLSLSAEIRVHLQQRRIQ